MAGTRLQTLLAPSVRKHVIGGFVAVLVLLVVLSGVTLQLMGPLAAGARRVSGDSATADAATAVSLGVRQAHALAMQYALSGSLTDQKAAQDSLASLDQSIAQTGSTSGRNTAAGDEGSLPALVGRYRVGLDGTFEAVQKRRTAVAGLRAAGTELRTITSAIAAAVDRETDPDLIHSGMRLAQRLLETDVAAFRYATSRDAADADIAKTAIAALPAAIDELSGHAGDNKRIRRFIGALPQPLAAYSDALTGLMAADDQLQRAETERTAASAAVLVAAATQREQAAGSQREAVASMLVRVVSVRRLLLGASVVAVGIGLTLALLIGLGISRPILLLTRTMQRLAEGDLSLEIPALHRRDEIGQMAHALLVFRRNAQTARDLQAEAEQVRAAKDRRQAVVERHIHDFSASAAGVMQGLQHSAGEAHTAAQEVHLATQRTRASSEETAQGAAGSAARLATVAAATEEMSASIAEIGQQAARAAVVARDAVERATNTNNKVGGMAAAAERVGTVISLIQTIAGQTNLLALNATIEAARAGEAGRGFAVVANEVKALAAQTAQATSEIAAQIGAIRSATGEAVGAVREVGAVIAQIEQIATIIASAVEEQATTTREIASSVQTTTVATRQTSAAMQDVSEVSETADVASRRLLTLAEDVGRTTETLGAEMQQFMEAMAREAA
jgi:methyl-accepting chemotaxis protein